MNLGTDREALHQTLKDDEAQEMMEENQCLAEVELLLDVNTNYELKNLHLRQKLQNLVNDTAHFPGMNSDSELLSPHNSIANVHVCEQNDWHISKSGCQTHSKVLLAFLC
jgi:hypothetical protein